jgi:hypothetical protein
MPGERSEALHAAMFSTSSLLQAWHMHIFVHWVTSMAYDGLRWAVGVFGFLFFSLLML